MFKYIALCEKEEQIGYDETTTYDDFLTIVQEKFKLREGSFVIKELNEYNFEESIMVRDFFEIERSEKDKALERLRCKDHFSNISTTSETEDFLLVYGFSVDNLGRTPLHWAVSNGNLKIVKLLLGKNFKNLHQEDSNGLTPLFFAVATKKINIVRLILTKNFDNAHKGISIYNTPLAKAKYMGLVDIIDILEKDIYKRKNNN